MLRIQNKTSSLLTILMATILFISGCATSPKVKVIQPGDNNLTREQLKEEISRLDRADSEVDSKKGVTGTNVAAALFFWPGLLYTHMDASEATRLIEQRRSHLMNLYNQKVAQDGERKGQRRS
jgi:hypothetical protein